MAECNACGARVSSGEHFCGNCGTQQLPIDSELKTIAADISDDLSVQADLPAQDEPPPPGSEAVVTVEPKPISSASLGGAFTDNVHISETGTPRGTGGKRAAVKQLDSSTILN